jgi:purine-binding chemotaxis protein CheW
MSELVVQDTFGIGINNQEEVTKYATFTIGGEMFGVNALNVQEIVLFQRMTKVPHSADYILGLINLRGQIVTAIDLRFRLTNTSTEINEDSMNFILKTDQGICSVIVDDVGDVMDINETSMEPAPETMDAKMREYVSKICKLQDRLLCVLDIEKIVKVG